MMMPTRADSQPAGASVRTIDTFEHGPLPVLDTWRQCRHTKTGWTAINEAGERLNITYRPEERGYGPRACRQAIMSCWRVLLALVIRVSSAIVCPLALL
jgi:hypothetical protein